MKRIYFTIMLMFSVLFMGCGETERKVYVAVSEPGAVDQAQLPLTREEKVIDWSIAMENIIEQTQILESQLLTEGAGEETFATAYTAAEKMESIFLDLLFGVPPSAEGLSGIERDRRMTEYRELVYRYLSVISKLQMELKRTHPDSAAIEKLVQELLLNSSLTREAHEKFM